MGLAICSKKRGPFCEHGGSHAHLPSHPHYPIIKSHFDRLNQVVVGRRLTLSISSQFFLVLTLSVNCSMVCPAKYVRLEDAYIDVSNKAHLFDIMDVPRRNLGDKEDH